MMRWEEKVEDFMTYEMLDLMPKRIPRLLLKVFITIF